MSDDSTREMPALDKIHILFLLYSAAHNVINAYHRANNLVFFLFVLVGILSVELMLWAIYNHWKDGRLIGPMLRVSLWAGFFAMFYATAGILAQAQTGGDSSWLNFYYSWIMPTSAPVMFLFSFFVQAVDPITQADRDDTAFAHKVRVEQKKEVLDKKLLELNNRSNIRQLKAHVQNSRINMLWKEAFSRRTRATLKKVSRVEMPLLLKAVGIKVPESKSRFSWFGGVSDAKVLEETSGDGHAPDPDDMEVRPGKR